MELSQIVIGFNYKAKKIFFSLFEKFKGSARSLDRIKDENVFQHQQAKYLQALKHQLESLAMELLHRNKTLKQISQLNKKLADGINQYLKEFRQKSRSL